VNSDKATRGKVLFRLTLKDALSKSGYTIVLRSLLDNILVDTSSNMRITPELGQLVGVLGECTVRHTSGLAFERGGVDSSRLSDAAAAALARRR
jgi:propanediol dehydratase small subunit